MKNYLVYFLLCIPGFVSAQTILQKTYGGPRQDYGFGLVSTSDGGFAMVGHTNSYANNFDVLLIKLDSDANLQWSRTYGGDSTEEGMRLVQTTDGGFAISGTTRSYGSGNIDALLIKTDGNGNLQWIKTYGGPANDGFINLRETKDHGFILSGSTMNYGQGNGDMLFVKTDSVGDTLWTKIVGGINSDQGTDGEQTADGGYIFSGRQSSWGSGSGDIFIMKTDASGDSIWSRVFGSPFWDEGMKVKQTMDKGYIVTGASIGFTNSSYDVYLNKIDSTGNLTWSKLYAGLHNDATYDVLCLSDGGYIVTGETESFGNNHLRPYTGNTKDEIESARSINSILGTDHSNVLMIRTDANGDTVWARTYGGNKLDEAYTMIQAADSGFVTLSFSTSFSNDSIDFHLVKTDKDGFSGCFETPAPFDVLSPATVIMPVAPQMISGVSVTTAFNVPSAPSVTQHTICFASTGINAFMSNDGMILYPNPAQGILHISLPVSFTKDCSVEIYNVLGDRITQRFVRNSSVPLEINISNFPEGIYSCRIVSGKEIRIEKFVKE
jgi:hypothetical protein